MKFLPTRPFLGPSNDIRKTNQALRKDPNHIISFLHNTRPSRLHQTVFTSEKRRSCFMFLER